MTGKKPAFFFLKDDHLLYLRLQNFIKFIEKKTQVQRYLVWPYVYLYTPAKLFVATHTENKSESSIVQKILRDGTS